MNFKRSVNRVFIHCSASDDTAYDNAATIRQWHLARKFDDIGYHFYIRKDGTIEKGRNLEKIPAAQEGHNKGSIAICLGGLRKENFTEAQFDALRSLCLEIHQERPLATFHGHCEVNKYKTCPVFNYRQVLNLDAKGVLLAGESNGL